MKQLVFTLLTVAVLCACRHYDGPPKTDHLGPEPEAHDGIFVSGTDTLFFNGDGKSIRWSLSKPVDSLNVKGEGSYVFKLYNGKYRYDAAEEFGIYDGKKLHTFMSGPNANTEEQIVVHFFGDGKDDMKRTFKKIKK